MNRIITLAKKELNYFLNSAIGYVVVVPFLLISFFLYFRTTFVFGLASLRSFFDLLPWFLVLLCPAITMHSLAEEKNKKTLELLTAHPISELQIVVSKFLGALFFYLLILAATLPLVIPLFVFSKIDAGVLAAQYLGAAATGATFLSIGIFASSLSASLISSFLIGTSLSFVMVLLGLDFVTLSLPQPLAALAGFASVSFHNQSISRGLLDLTDVLYFVTAAAAFLILAVFKISQNKIAEKKSEKTKLAASLAITLVVAVLLNLAGNSFPVRIDLTANKNFSLSPATRATLSKIDDILTIKTFISPDLPPGMQNVARDVKDTLGDYGRFGKKIKIENHAAQTGSSAAEEAQKMGIYPVQFNTIGASSYQLQSGYLGLALRFGDKTETLPFIQSTTDLEYQLTRKINKLTEKVGKKVFIFTGAEAAAQPGQNDLLFGKLANLLSSQYEVSLTSLDKTFEQQKADLLIVAGIKNPLEPAQVEEINKYLSSGGKALVLADKVAPDVGSSTASAKTTNLENLLSDYGVTLNSDLAYDAALAETIQFTRGTMGFLVPYPFWLKALPADSNFPPTSQVRFVSLIWPSTLSVADKNKMNAKIILKTSKNGGVLTGSNYVISPDSLEGSNLKPGGRELGLGAVVTRKDGNAILAVITDSKFASDNYASPNNQNLPFSAGLVDYLALGPNEIVPIKSGAENFFMFTAPWQPAAVQWGETIGVPLLVAIFAAVKLWRRKVGFSRVYKI